MKFKSSKNWATVLCAAAVFSLIVLRDAQAAGRPLAVLPPPPISITNDGTDDLRNPPPPPPPIDDDLGGEDLIGSFSGTMMVD